MLWLVSFSTTLIFTYKTITIAILITEATTRDPVQISQKGEV